MNKIDVDASECGFIDKLRKPKIFNMALFDWIATILVGGLIGMALSKKYTNDYYDKKYIIWSIIIVIILAPIAHVLFKTPTMFNYYLGLNTKEEVLANRKTC
jgi:hypothetical protein